MKTKKCFLIIFLYGSLLYAQDFSTKFYLTNKHGAKDSLELGYSSSATFGIDSQFGEVGYSTPVNFNKFGASIIINGSNEMLSQIIQNNKVNYFSKKQIVPFMLGSWIEQNAIGIMIPADSLPVTITWDKTQFLDIQRNFSLITDWPVGFWFDAGGSSFLENLKDTNSIRINDSIVNDFYTNGIYFYTSDTIETPMYIFYVAFANAGTIINGIKDINADKQIKVYPTITNSYVYIKNKTASRILKTKTLTLSGKLIETINDNLSGIDLSNYPNGIYLLSIETTENITYTKIIKN